MSFAKSKRLYEQFREKTPTRVRKIYGYRWPKSLMVMGYCSAIEYETSHGGKFRAYRHKFAKGSRALLCAGPGKGQLFLIGGRFHVTDRGIVDLTPRGKEIDD